MTEMAREAFASRNYSLAAEIYERYLDEQNPNYEICFGYGDSLSRCGRIREAIDVYAQCFELGSVPIESLKHLSTALLESVKCAAGPRRRSEPSFACPSCEGILFQPVTAACGHTYCRTCFEPNKGCKICGQKLGAVGETNVLIQRLVEKWWPAEAEASRERHEGDRLLKEGHVSQAMEHYNLAVQLAPNNPLHLTNRAHASHLLNRPQASLSDADHAVRLRPDWGKGHYRRGVALSCLGRHEEAFSALCTCVAIDGNPQPVRQELTRLLHRMLAPNLRRQNVISSRAPYHLGQHLSARNRRNRIHQILLPLMSPIQNHQREALNTSDCEDNSSGEEELITQSMCRRLLSATESTDNGKLHAILDRVYQEVKKLKFDTRLPTGLLPPLTISGTSSGEFDCILCCRVLWKPVTTPCGHTYCWMCLDRCLDYSSACPLCVTSLADYFASSQKAVTDFVERALKIVTPVEYAARAASHRLELVQGLGLGQGGGEEIAIFICTTSFPWVPCPLFVYEPRYRLMVRRCIEGGIRQFGIAACLNREATGPKKYAEYGTMLEMKDRVLLKDGCSILSTMGGRRFRVLSGGEKDGYDTAQVEFLRDSVVQPDQLMGLLELHDKVRTKGQRWWSTVAASQQDEIQRVFGGMPEPENDWPLLPDGPSWTWWLLAILPLGPQLQVGILGTTSLEKRLRAIEKTLDHMEQRQLTVAAAPSEETTTPVSICRDEETMMQNSVETVVQES
ncbi:LON peptidase N-terminal domain and RING finger protein 3 [Athalia rosae]|uniref:LON peptidase N-terminal domain and RING finger protein 3 n=1 Tax=Athalia rosae TaxID=37344 RepID=UPI002033440F|nr:LON peptidase N-terminal domain and RING finger protein 3 [Athalia rosae]XP_048506867.1 LON peptidase N-terminal domain and RING finger protein 3 [Athalia rosae]XP_048506868.1 LON peptidase N-terminal domain and RING finger protein 3 [Athalia rosae]